MREEGRKEKKCVCMCVCKGKEKGELCPLFFSQFFGTGNHDRAVEMVSRAKEVFGSQDKEVQQNF